MPPASSAAPCILVASPSLECPFFGGTVVLLVEHNEDGSLGFVVNKPSPMGFDDVASQLQLPTRDDQPAPAPVLVGGPVQPDSGWLLLGRGAATIELPGPEDGTVALPKGLTLSASMAALESVARGEGPEQTVLFLGYAGWGPGQLGDEFRDGSWIPVDLDPRLLFDLPVEDRWRAALATLGVHPGRIATGGGVAAQA